MSAMPARVTELPGGPTVDPAPGPVQQRRTDRRAEQKLARRDRRRWAAMAGVILVGSFGLTVGILDVLH
jgi:hypothetical protein